MPKSKFPDFLNQLKTNAQWDIAFNAQSAAEHTHFTPMYIYSFKEDLIRVFTVDFQATRPMLKQATEALGLSASALSGQAAQAISVLLKDNAVNSLVQSASGLDSVVPGPSGEFSIQDWTFMIMLYFFKTKTFASFDQVLLSQAKGYPSVCIAQYHLKKGSCYLRPFVVSNETSGLMSPDEAKRAFSDILKHDLTSPSSSVYQNIMAGGGIVRKSNP